MPGEYRISYAQEPWVSRNADLLAVSGLVGVFLLLVWASQPGRPLGPPAPNP